MTSLSEDALQAFGSPPQPPGVLIRPRKRKACQRCRIRKQRCDVREPACQNCVDAGVECTPATQGATKIYPVAYIQSLEGHVADLEKRLNEQVPMAGSNSFDTAQPQYFGASDFDMLTEPQNAFDMLQGQFLNTPQINMTNNASYDDGSAQEMDTLFEVSEPQIQNRDASAGAVYISSMSSPATQESPRGNLAGSQFEVSVSAAGSFFQTYFKVIHLRYPFLDVEECSNAYLQWKASSSQPRPLMTGWSVFLVKMIFAVGSIIQQSRLDNTTGRQHQKLLLQAQAEQGSITNATHKPLVRLQAMLLHTIYAMYGESTSRLVHIAGVAMRFATLYGFHKLRDDGRKDLRMEIKVWSSLYAIDRMICATFCIPVSLSDQWITSPLYETSLEPTHLMPWISDFSESAENQFQAIDLSTFSHMCKLRYIQSKTMHNSLALSEEDIPGFIVTMQSEIENWAQSENIYLHSQLHTEGYLSPLFLGHMSQIARVHLYSSVKTTIGSTITDRLFQACCDTCTSFRAVQKKRQIEKSWVNMVFEFQVAVTLLYIIWRRAVPVPEQVDHAIRDCMSVLAIYADRSPNAEHYRDYLEVLANSVSRRSHVGNINEEAREELAKLSEKVEEAGIASHVSEMLSEMCRVPSGQ